MSAQTEPQSSPLAPNFSDDRLRLGRHVFASRLIVGTGLYDNREVMVASLANSRTQCVTVAVRREKLYDRLGVNILDALPLDRITLLPNTAGCYTAEEAIRTARLGREILRSLENPGADWVKLEVLGDSKTLLPHPLETVRATERLVTEGFQVLCYTNDDPVMARQLKGAGALAVMPAGSPIGSGQGILNPNSMSICREYLKEGDPDYPFIVDAGVGTASDVAIAFELGADGVLLNTAIAHAADPPTMATAMYHAALAGRAAYLAGRIPKRRFANASSPVQDFIGPRSAPQ